MGLVMVNEFVKGHSPVDCPPGCFSKSGEMLMYKREEEKWISNLNFWGKTGDLKRIRFSEYPNRDSILNI